MDLQSLKNKYRIIGKNATLHFALEVAIQASKTDLSILIMGESGVGKEAFSKIIHSNSSRKHSPFIAINCGALPEGTINSELFGHEKGSFTGATDNRKGYFETTNEGTIFLDEISEMPLNTQARLLRILESGEYIRVGSSEVKKTNVRIIAATNKNLLHLIQTGKFREDLYYRLSTIPIRVPALRERKEDIYLLFRFFANEFAEKYKTEPIQLLDDAKERLTQYLFPGNIRELKNIVERLSVFSEQNKQIDAIHLTKMVDIQAQNPLPILYKNNSLQIDDHPNQEVLIKMFFDLKKEVADIKNVMMNALNHPENNPIRTDWNENENFEIEKNTLSTNTTFIVKPEKKEHNLLEENLNLIVKEKEYIIKALGKHKGKQLSAAIELGISSRTLSRKIIDYNLDSKSFKMKKK